VRLVLVQDGGLSYDDAEDGVTCILLSYHRRTGDYPWQETKPDVLLLRTLCHDYASAYWRKQKRRERLLDGWMPPSPEGSGHLEAIAIGELCAVDINDAFPTSARVMQNYGAYIPFNMPSLSDYSLKVWATDNTDGFTDVAEKRMRVHFPIEGWRQLGLEEHPIKEWVQSGPPYRPCPTKLALGINPPNDWDLLTVVTGPATFQRTDNWQTSLTVTGAIQLQPGVTLGSDVVKLAFQVNAGVTLGTTYTRASGTTYTWTVPAGQRWKFYWGFAHLCLRGLCDIYDQAGYAGTCTWELLKWQSDPSGAVSIVYTYRVEPYEP
jgi:hypothetical protein